MREGRLLSIDYEGRKRLPQFQFSRRRFLPGLETILPVLPKDLNPLDVAQWFLEPNLGLETNSLKKLQSPRQWLLAGKRVETVAAAARNWD